MADIQSFGAGINTGSWISQYGDRTVFDGHITEQDVARIKQWGFSHIRLPFDYPVIMNKDISGFSDGIRHIDNMVAWCKSHGLKIILDLHKAPGYFFGDVGKTDNDLMSNPATQARFLHIWDLIARRYKDEDDDFVAYELLNEVVEGPADAWNALVTRAVDVIRRTSPTKLIIYGGIYYNSVYQLINMKVFDDPNIVYNFHFYDPILFSHQYAAWNKVNMDYFTSVEYPGEFPRLAQFIDAHPEYANLKRYIGKTFDRALIQEDLNPVKEFYEKNNHPMMYCGEFGVVNCAGRASRLRWFSDLKDEFSSMRIAHAVWDYKEGPRYFSMIDPKTNDVLDDELIKVLSRPL